ncbi:MAG: site-2 protease family protein [Leptospiraceae bacterium]|nr:site-2 protease family protein [Leptospiraceae bacterium]MCP5499379.1 site-2 protease family protein [Leptospiraceae bacterium]
MKTHSLSFHIFLLLLTFISTTFQQNTFVIFFLEPSIVLRLFFLELPYSFSLLFILFCHEMGHYLPSRYYNIRATLPYFIPFPLGPIGTMGAVIRVQDPIPDKKKLFDIGAGGPLMSLILSLPAWIGGLYLSELKSVEGIIDNPNTLIFGDSLFTYFSAKLIFGNFDPSQVDIILHPLAKAGWVGLLITAINLLPFGQLDGGHVIYSLFGEKYRNWIHYLFTIFLFMNLLSLTWLIWSLLIYKLVKVEHPYVPDSYEPLDWKRKVLGYTLLFSFILTFVPEPLKAGGENVIPLYKDLLNMLQYLF